MMARAAAVVLATVLVGCAHSSPTLVGLEVEGKDVYVGEGGLRVEVLRLKDPDAKCLLHVVGSGTDFDGHVVGCRHVRENRDVFYVVPWRGSDWRVFSHRVDGGDGRLVTTKPEPDYLSIDDVGAAALDTAPLLKKYAEEVDNGVLAALARFDRAEYLARADNDIAQALAATNKACDSTFTARVDWATAKDDELRRRPLWDAARRSVAYLGTLCSLSPRAKQWLREHVKGLRASLLPLPEDTMQEDLVTWKDGVLTYGLRGAINFEATILGTLSPATAPPSAATSPWGDGSSLANRLALDGMKVCGDAQGRLVAYGPHLSFDGNPHSVQLYAGGRETVVQVRPVSNRLETWFIDGRYPKKNAPAVPQPGMQPLDLWRLKFVSGVEIDDTERTCTVTCGDRTTKVPFLEKEAGIAALTARTFAPPPFDRWPHALLRDDAGTYYFVDTSTLPDREKDFRVYVGTRGRMQKMTMVNTLSDTTGELFSTKKGDLRLLLNRDSGSHWQVGKTKKPLKVVPVEENLDIIFIELGVYAGQRLGNPCDDF